MDHWGISCGINQILTDQRIRKSCKMVKDFSTEGNRSQDD